MNKTKTPAALVPKVTNPKDRTAFDKLPLWLLSPVSKAWWAVAQAIGARKYGLWNWRGSPVSASVYISAAHRHLDDYLSGETFDAEGNHHLGAVMACASILIDAAEAGTLVDDRPPHGDVPWAKGEWKRQVAETLARVARTPRHADARDYVECDSAPH